MSACDSNIAAREASLQQSRAGVAGSLRRRCTRTKKRSGIGLAPEQVGAFWIDRRIRDESAPPRSVPSADLALRVAASLPGAITYVAPEAVNAAVRVLTIDGKAPGHAEYLLK